MHKKMDDLTKLMNKSVKPNFLDVESVIDVRFVNETSRMKIILDSGAPYAIMSNKWMAKYIKEGGVYKDTIEYENCFP